VVEVQELLVAKLLQEESVVAVQALLTQLVALQTLAVEAVVETSLAIKLELALLAALES
jgi:hypothetical protein